MKKQIAERIISNIDDEYINEALLYRSKRKPRAVTWIGRFAACGALVLVLSVSSLSAAVAAGNSEAYEIMKLIAPDIALKLTPVNVSCEDEGIRMEVESVYVHGDSAEIYISMEDLTGDRIDGTMDLFDSYRVQTGRDQIGTCSLCGYDEETKKATFLISVQNMGGESIDGKQMSFSVSQFLSGKTDTEMELKEISLNNIPTAPAVQTDITKRGGSGVESDTDDLPQYLVPDESISFIPVPGATVTGYGFIDGCLHIQVYYEDILHFDNHGWIYLKDAQGNVHNDLGNIAFWDEERKGSYEEYIFDLSPEDDLTGYSVWGSFTTCQNLTTGNWKVTFPIENRE